MQKEQVLQNFGLTKAEVGLYLKLITLGEATASDLAKKTNTNRTFTYDRLKKLLGVGLISYVIKDHKKYFKAAEPDQLLAILKEKEEQVIKILPELERLKSPTSEDANVNIFSSNKGIRTALNQILKDKKQVYIHGSMFHFKENMGSYYRIWNSRRVKEKISLKVLSNEELELDLAETETLPEEEKSSLTTFSFGNKVIIALWADVPLAISIENEEIAKDHIAFFNAIWNREIKIYSGVDGIIKAFFELISKESSYYVGIGYSRDLAKIYGPKMSDNWHLQRLEKNIPARLISYDDPSSKKYFHKRMKQWKKFDIRFLDKTLCGPACVTLTEHLIVTFIYTEKDFKVIVNKNKETIAVYKKHFDVLWKLTKKIK